MPTNVPPKRRVSSYIWLTLILLTTTIVAPPSNANKWQMGYNSAFKELTKSPCAFAQDMCCTVLQVKLTGRQKNKTRKSCGGVPCGIYSNSSYCSFSSHQRRQADTDTSLTSVPQTVLHTIHSNRAAP
jgi:hypothetical protein